MICQSCKSDKATVYRTLRADGVTSRECKCKCGATWWTDERYRRGSLHMQLTNELLAAKTEAEKAQENAASNQGSPFFGGLGANPGPDSGPIGPPESGSEILVLTKKTRGKLVELPGFHRWWALQVRKEGRKAALKAWHANDCEQRTGEICAAYQKQRFGFLQREVKHVPMPATWLNGERWTDEVKVNRNPNALPDFVPHEPGKW